MIATTPSSFPRLKRSYGLNPFQEPCPPVDRSRVDQDSLTRRGEDHRRATWLESMNDRYAVSSRHTMKTAVLDKSALREVFAPFPVPNKRQNITPSVLLSARRSRPSLERAMTFLFQEMRWKVANVSIESNAVRAPAVVHHTTGHSTSPANGGDCAQLQSQ